MSRLFHILAGLLALLLAVPAAFAQVVGPSFTLTALPATVHVAGDRDAAITVTWQVRSNVAATLTSGSGSFEPRLGTVPQLFTRTLAAGATALVTENVRIPLAVIRKALDGKLSSFTYQRQFFSGEIASNVAQVSIAITGSQAASLAVSRQAIAFDDNTPVRIVAPRALLAAWSEVTLSGSGLLEGVWEIAEPPTTSGLPVFRTLGLVRRFAMSGTPLRLDAPVLPTASSGLYLVRLRLTQPQPGFDTPEIRYFVAQPGAAPVARELRAVSPQPGALLETDTRFSWAPQEGVQSWMLLIYQRPTGLAGNLPDLGPAALPDAAELAQLDRAAPTAGMVVAGGQTGTTLSAMARSHLKPGNAYLWRVLGLGRDGVVLGESPWRVIRIP